MMFCLKQNLFLIIYLNLENRDNLFIIIYIYENRGFWFDLTSIYLDDHYNIRFDRSIQKELIFPLI